MTWNTNYHNVDQRVIFRLFILSHPKFETHVYSWYTQNSIKFSHLRNCKHKCLVRIIKSVNFVELLAWLTNCSNTDTFLLARHVLCAWLRWTRTLYFQYDLGVRTDWERTSHHTVTVEADGEATHTSLPSPDTCPATSDVSQLPCTHKLLTITHIYSTYEYMCLFYCFSLNQ